LFSGGLFAQTSLDSSFPVRDSTVQLKDSSAGSNPVLSDTLQADTISKRPMNTESWKIPAGETLSSNELNLEILKRHPYFGFASSPVTLTTFEKKFNGKEILFYLLVALLLSFALLKWLFPKYLADMFRLFFRTTLKQRQIREQLIQSPLPSLLFNVFFVLTSALYVDLLLLHFGLLVVNFWEMFLLCGLALSFIYFVKFLGLKISGWIFNAKGVTDSYIFIVFIVNKMLGIFLLPFLIVLAFSQGDIYQVALMVTWCGIALLYLYRLVLSYGSVRNQIKINLFHFLLYIVTFEIAPLLVIYKVLLYFFSRTA